ncbi:hypothetical protein [Planosporangium thailandense]|nr:hypothetical protein [Planosporangium thailandense]
MHGWGGIVFTAAFLVALLLARLPAARRYRQRRLEQHEARRRRRP